MGSKKELLILHIKGKVTMRKVSFFVVIAIMLVITVAIIFGLSSKNNMEYKERFLPEEDLLLCFTLSGERLREAVTYQIDKNGKVLRGQGVAVHSVSCRDPYTADGDPKSIIPLNESEGILYEEFVLTAAQLSRITEQAEECIKDQGGEHNELYGNERPGIHVLYYAGKSCIGTIDRLGFKKDGLSLIGYALEEYCGTVAGWYDKANDYIDKIKEHYNNDSEFININGKVENAIPARELEPINDEYGKWLPYIVSTQKTGGVLVYAKYAGRNPNGDYYLIYKTPDDPGVEE